MLPSAHVAQLTVHCLFTMYKTDTIPSNAMQCSTFNVEKVRETELWAFGQPFLTLLNAMMGLSEWFRTRLGSGKNVQALKEQSAYLLV